MKNQWLAVVAIAGFCLTPLSSLAQVNVSALNLKLQESVQAQNWGQAIQIIDQLLIATPERAAELKPYRARLLQLQQAGVKVAPKPGTTAIPSRPTPAILGQVPIKRRQGGIAIVDVTFNRRVPFEMLVDSGASSTVITRQMASALGITPANIVQTVQVSTANGRTVLPVVYVDQIELAGLSISQVPVLVGGAEMEIGLLGQDFLRNYDVTIRQNLIEFHPRR